MEKFEVSNWVFVFDGMDRNGPECSRNGLEWAGMDRNRSEWVGIS